MKRKFMTMLCIILVCITINNMVYANTIITKTEYSYIARNGDGFAIPETDIYLCTDKGSVPSFYWVNYDDGSSPSTSQNVSISWASNQANLVNSVLLYNSNQYNGKYLTQNSTENSGTAILYTGEEEHDDSSYYNYVDWTVQFKSEVQGDVVLKQTHGGITYTTNIHLYRETIPVDTILLQPSIVLFR